MPPKYVLDDMAQAARAAAGRAAASTGDSQPRLIATRTRPPGRDCFSRRSEPLTARLMLTRRAKTPTRSSRSKHRTRSARFGFKSARRKVPSTTEPNATGATRRHERGSAALHHRRDAAHCAARRARSIRAHARATEAVPQRAAAPDLRITNCSAIIERSRSNKLKVESLTNRGKAYRAQGKADAGVVEFDEAHRDRSEERRGLFPSRDRTSRPRRRRPRAARSRAGGEIRQAQPGRVQDPEPHLLQPPRIRPGDRRLDG